VIATLLLVGTLAIPAGAAALTQLQREPRRSGRTVTVASGLASIVAIVLLILTAADDDGTIGGEVLRVDRAMAILLVVVLGTATVVASFSSRSLDWDERAPGFFSGLALLVAGSTAVLVAGEPLVLVAGWIVSGWALARLVTFDGKRREVTAARRRIVRSLAVGDTALLAAAAVLAVQAGDALRAPGAAAAELDDASVAGVPSLHLVAVLLVVAGASRSALVPFHRWLVGTLVAPTPVSALVHAGLVSGAGILLVRFAPTFVASSPAVVLAMAVATATVLLAAVAATARPDAKGALAWSTVAQMGFMVVQCAVGAFSSAVVHIAGHGMYKAARFLGVGDTVSAAVRARRRPTDGRPVPPAVQSAVVLVVATGAVALGMWSVPPLVNDAGRVLVAVFAWVTVATSLSGWIRRRPMAPLATIVTGVGGAFAATFAYLGGLRAVETFVKPVLASPDTAVGPVALGAVAALLALAAVTTRLPGRIGATTTALVERSRIRFTEERIRPWPTPVDRGPIPVAVVDDDERSRIRSDVATATSIVSPLWPLSSFVAVNPLGGLEPAGFDRATATARRWLGARTHLTLDEFWADHERGASRLADLEYVVHQRYAELCARPALEIEGRLVQPVDVVVADLLHGPELDEPLAHRTRLDRCAHGAASDLVDAIVTGWLARHVSEHPPTERFVARCRRLATDDPRLASVLSRSARAWLAGLGDDAGEVVGAAFDVAGVRPEQRVDEARGHLAHLAGWAGLAKWRNEWAAPNDPRPTIAPIEIVAVRAALEAAMLSSAPTVAGADDAADERGGAAFDDRAKSLLDARVAAVAAVLAPGGRDRDLEAIRSVLAAVDHDARAPMWLQAQERCFDERLLGVLARVDPGRRTNRPDAQAVFCIDVRSEGLRRHLEEFGDVETFGFAGFFGVPLAVRHIGWEHDEARCPVLVAPSVPAIEHADPRSIGAIARQLGAERRRAGLLAAHDASKKSPSAPYVLAEALGWVTGPSAAVRTLLPPHASTPPARSTRVVLADSVLVEQRIFAAESVLRTMGLVEAFAPLVLLCGHTSRTVNNAHASALDCGACGGAAGDDNALAVAALLNAPDVRHGLAERGIEIPDDTWFVAGLHDTASDHVTVLDAATVPAEHLGQLERLQAALARAGAAQATARAPRLPGRPERVRDRGADWAQVRPEWGLARAAAFVIGPRSLTAGLDLDGRAFLHGYDAQHDPTGRVLETIMTAPLVVAHWIASQYYFSTVDPEVFGAGDKLMHNPIGSVGVVSGEGGDLRVGLPLQSTHVHGRRHHQPIRLLAVIQADLARIEEIIGRHRILQVLVAGSWLRIAARSHPHEPWSTRTPAGTWITNPRPFDDETTIAEPTALAHVEMT